MTSLRRLRVFDCTRGTPTRDLGMLHSHPRNVFSTLSAVYLVPGAKLSLQFELAMFLFGPPASLVAYEMYLAVATQNTIFQTVRPEGIQVLRLSGRCRFPQHVKLPALRQLTICGATSSYLDQHLEHDLSSSSDLRSFRYSQGDRMGFQMTDSLLSSLAHRFGRTLRQLVLLECNKLSTASLGSSLRQLQVLEYLALSLTTFNEMDYNFAQDIPQTVVVLKLRFVRCHTQR